MLAPLLLCAALPQGAALLSPALPTPGNVLIVLADDVGVDQLGCYGEGGDPATTPTLDALAASGVLFRHAYASQMCSPSRASIQTGRYGIRTGIGGNVGVDTPALSTAEVTLPEMLDLGTGGSWAHAYIGKWHIGNDTVGGPLAPNLAGWSHFAGTQENLVDYFSWEYVVDGLVTIESTYCTTKQTNDALAWISKASEPWLCQVSYNAPHSPYHEPPAGLHYDPIPPIPPVGHPDATPWFQGMVESVDVELGRLLTRIDPAVLARTTVIFLGDNGTPGYVTKRPFLSTHAKLTPYEGGINVPFIVSGPLVQRPGRESAALVQAVDLFATVAEIAGVEPASVLPAGTVLDSRSIVPLLTHPGSPPVRPFAFANGFEPNGPAPYQVEGYGLTDGRWKLVRQGGFLGGLVDEFYDLWRDPFEVLDLVPKLTTYPGAAQAYDALTAELDALLAGA